MISPVMRTEERLRAATRAAADTVAPGSAPPLRLPDAPAARSLRGGGPRRRRWLRALTPLAAAAAVVAAIATGLAITHSWHGHPGRAHRSGAATGAQVSGVPAYYVALSETSGHAAARGHPRHRHREGTAPPSPRPVPTAGSRS